MISIRSSVNLALDKAYNRTAGRMLVQIAAITNAPRSAMQRSLAKLDDEAARLDEAGDRMLGSNAQFQQTMGEYQNALNATAVMIQANDNAIQETGQALAVPAVTAKVFSQISQGLDIDPVSPAAMKIYREAVNTAGINWAMPDATTFATDYVDTAAWASKMEGWGSGYHNKTRDTLLKGIDEGWGPIRTAQMMRKHAQQIPRSAAENLTRTLQLTSYRDASVAMEVANSRFVDGKIRIATLDVNTCLSCISLHGTPLKIGERVDDHYRGRCSEFYQVAGGPRFPSQMQADSLPGQRNFVPYQSGLDWFNSLSAARQASQASFRKSPAKFRAFNAGTPLSAFWAARQDDVFGRQIFEQSLIRAIGKDAEKFYTINQKGK